MAKYNRLAIAMVAGSSVAFSVPILSAPRPATAFAQGRTAASNLHRSKVTALLAQKRERYNPLSMFGDIASSFLSGGDGSSADPSLDATVSSAFGSTWDNIRSKLESAQTEEEKRFRPNLEKGHGAASPLNLVRLYDKSNREEDIRVTFYRDHASWCPYCHKVWMCLEEKRIPYRVEKINMRCYGEKPASFSRMQPSGAIPVAVIDGKVYNQSNDIIFALEQLFPHAKSLAPNSDEGRARAQTLLRLERNLFSQWMAWLTGGYGKENFIEVLRHVDYELQSSTGGDFFMGKDVTLVDFMFAPFLERIAASMLNFKGYQIRVASGEPTEFPAVNKWFDAMETLESYQLTKSDYYTHCWDLPPQLGGCSYEKDGEPYERAINGDRSLDGTRGSWELPLKAHNDGIEPDWDWCGDESAALREATERLSFNHTNIVKFAARGAGKKGMPPYGAPLADPNAISNDAVSVSVDTILRVISSAMLEGTDNFDDTMAEVARAIVKEGGKSFAQDVVNSLAYLRDRIGVPRDMRLPAARQLRAHLNWAIGKLLVVADL